MADELVVVDGPQSLVSDRPEGRLFELSVRVEGAAGRPTVAELGPALNALYARALEALLVDPTLGGRAIDVREGSPDGPALEVQIDAEPYTGPSGMFGLTVAVPYWQSAGAPAPREAILAALTTALEANVLTATPCARERVLVAFRTHLETALGFAIRRNTDRPHDATQGPAVILRDGDQGADYLTQGLAFYTAHPAVEVFVPGKDTAALDAVMQIVLEAIRTADTLGGLAIDVTEGNADRTDPDVLRHEYTGPLLAGRVELEAVFATPMGRPYEVAA